MNFHAFREWLRLDRPHRRRPLIMGVLKAIPERFFKKLRF